MVIAAILNQKLAIKHQKNWEVLLTVGNDLEEQFQSPGCSSKYGNLSKNCQKIAKKMIKKIEDVLTCCDNIKNMFRV